MAPDLFTLHRATKADLIRIDALLSASYPALLKHHYPPSVMVTAVPLISRANPRLIGQGTYFIITDEAGMAVSAGGWSLSGRAKDVGEVRHMVTHPGYLRRGLARRILDRVVRDAVAAGVRRLGCHAALGAEPFYAANDFDAIGPVTMPLRPGISFDALYMVRALGTRR